MGRIKNIIRNINYLSKHSLYDQREKDIVYLTNKILDDGIYEYNLEFDNYKKLKILDKKESIDLITTSGKSFVRFGDGEINLILGNDHSFQKYDKQLASDLLDMLKSKNDNIHVGINKGYYKPCFRAGDYEYMRRYGFDFRRFFDSYCDESNIYFDSSSTLCGFEKNYCNDMLWEKWVESFSNKEIVIICGNHILDKLSFDVFQKAKSKEFIYGPKINAWDKHKEIISRISKEVSKDKLLVFILGMAGKAMIPEVTQMGYVAWDVGHLAKGYDAYMKENIISKEDIHNFFEPD